MIAAEFAPILLAGCVLGLLHSFDLDHLAAMSTLIGHERAASWRGFLKGAAWGVGHTLSLGAFGLALVLLGAQLNGAGERVFEAAVGVLLIVLGVRRLRDARHGLHLHPHHHHDAHEHAHFHLHAPHHVHTHARHSHMPLWVGVLHGLAGTAGVMVLLPAVVLGNPATYLGYVAAFGAGSILSMGALCAGCASAMTRLRARHRNAGRWLAVCAGTVSTGVGIVWIGMAGFL